MSNMTISTTISTEDDEGVDFRPTTATCTINWKLYENPFYQNPSQGHFHKQLVRKYSANAKHIHRLHRDLKFDCPSAKMSSDLDQARAQIVQLKEELELERRMRKKAESLNKMMARELVDQRRDKEKMCDVLTKEMTQLKSELEKIKKEFESERKMLKMGQVLREGRVQMKLSDAKLLCQEKYPLTLKTPSNQKLSRGSSSSCSTSSSSSSTSSKSRVAGESKRSNLHVSNAQRKASPEAENPHIKRGIKGFVEFPRMVKAINGSDVSHSTSSRDMGTKLECQKAQLKILMRQKSSVASTNLVIS